MSDVWVLGATGRSGQAIAARLVGLGMPVVLVGRDAGRLAALAAELGGGPPVVVAGSVEAMAAEIGRGRPGVVVNTVGPFAETAVTVARACPAGTHYVDLSNELASFLAVFGLGDEAAASGRTLVSGAGFGVAASECLVLHLCRGRPAAERVRVDVMPAVAVEAGRVGRALAATIVGVLADGGRQYAGGRLVRTRLLADPVTLTRPDGKTVRTATGPSGELEAARRASGARFAAAASGLVPSSAVVRAVLPAALAVLRVGAIRHLAIGRVAAIKFKATAAGEPQVSWAHARVEWADGTVRDGWLRLGDAMDFTVEVAAAVATRLARGEGRPGAFTPGALFGSELAVVAGGQLVAD